MNDSILIVDDDVKLRDLLSEYFSGYGFKVRSLPDGSELLKELSRNPPSLLILDIMLPGEDGLELLRRVRREYAIPVVMLTARGDETDRIVGLELGADDYLPKPFNPRELMARVRAILRRSAPDKEEKRSEPHLRRGGLVLNTFRRTLRIGEEEEDLSTTEFNLMKALMENSNRALSRDELMNLAMGRDHLAYDRSIDVHISRLRARLEKDPAQRGRIKTVWGTGYMFVDEGDPS